MPELFLTEISSPAEPRPFQGPINQEEMWCGKIGGDEGNEGYGIACVSIAPEKIIVKEQYQKEDKHGNL